MRVDLPPGNLKNRVPAREGSESLTRKKVPPSRSAAGLLLMDSSLNPISFNAEAIQILGYPDKLANLRHTEVFLGEKIRSTLLSGQRSGDAPLVTEFRSGKRHYFCRAFLVDAHSKDPSHASIAVLDARPEQQGDCKSDERQSQHREGLSATDYDQDGSVLALGSCGENYDDPTVVVARSSFPHRSSMQVSGLTHSNN
jgi:hypothetical protein